MIDQTTAIDLDAIRARLAAASEGPWTAHDDGLVWAERPGDPVSGSTELVDAEFIAHARQDIPALIAEVERLRAELDRRSVPASVAVDAERVLDEIRADQRARGGDPR